MKIVRRDVYLSELSEMSFIQRLFVVTSGMKIDDSVLPNINPLDWCVRDLFKIVYLFAVGCLLWILSPLLIVDAVRLKTAYIDHEASWYKEDILILE